MCILEVGSHTQGSCHVLANPYYASHLGFGHTMHVRTHTECGSGLDGLAGRWVDNSEYRNSKLNLKGLKSQFLNTKRVKFIIRPFF